MVPAAPHPIHRPQKMSVGEQALDRPGKATALTIDIAVGDEDGDPGYAEHLGYDSLWIGDMMEHTCRDDGVEGRAFVRKRFT